MVSKPAVATIALAIMFAVYGCKQEVPSSNVASAPPSAPAPTPSAADSQTATPSSPTSAPGPAEQTGRKVGEVVDDATITTKIKAALLQSPEVKGLDVKVETQKGVVQLSGFVANQAQIDKAVEVAKGVTGVKEVQNKMSVKPS
jgi:hypothetical protein